MKVAVFSESSADEAAIRIIVDAVLGNPTEPVGLLGLRTRGYSGVVGTLPAVLKQLYYHTDAEGLVVVIDSDDSPVHTDAHDAPGGADPACRLCELQRIAALEMLRVRPVPGRAVLKTAIGLAVPAIEAWLHPAIGTRVSEPSWARALQSGQRPYDRRSLKRDLYGSDRVPITRETRVMSEAAQRLAQDLTILERWFPHGFGALARAVRAW